MGFRRSLARDFIIALQVVMFCAQDVSRTWDVLVAEERVWKKELEFSRRREMAWQFVIVLFVRQFL